MSLALRADVTGLCLPDLLGLAQVGPEDLLRNFSRPTLLCIIYQKLRHHPELALATDLARELLIRPLKREQRAQLIGTSRAPRDFEPASVAGHGDHLGRHPGVLARPLELSPEREELENNPDLLAESSEL